MSADGNPAFNGDQKAAETSDGRIKPGEVRNPAGRPKGARNKLERRFIMQLYKDFKEHGVEAIQKTRAEKPDAYLNVIAKILPKEINGDLNVHLSHEEAIKELE